MVGLLHILFAFVLGSAIGSFANAASMRTVAGRRWWGLERSECDLCGSAIQARDLLPVISFLALRGRCRSCGGKIAPRHFFAEISGGALCALFAWRFGASYAFAVSSASLVFLIFNSLTDAASGYIYDSWAFAMAGAGLILRIPGGLHAVADGAAGAAAGFGLIALIVLLSRRRMGMGDATLMLGIGAFAGFKLTLLSLYLGFAFGCAAVLPLLATGRVGRKTAVPLGPFLCAGMAASMLFGTEITGFFGFSLPWPWLP